MMDHISNLNPQYGDDLKATTGEKSCERVLLLA